MKNILLILTLLGTTLLTTACVNFYQNAPEDASKESENGMMGGDQMGMMDGGMDHEMMGHGMMGGDQMGMMITSDREFLEEMIPHHQEAIDTAEIILEKSTNEELKTLAQNIVDAQTTEIAQMQAWGKEWFRTELEPNADYKPMMPDLTVLEGKALDQAFIEGMIEHHRMAVMMAMHIQKITERQDILDMAKAIIEAQTKEIELMKSWLE